ncbi:MAG: PSD1 and planctomycete cytochrome C domain-containing protein [Pirellulales bacterium]
MLPFRFPFHSIRLATLAIFVSWGASLAILPKIAKAQLPTSGLSDPSAMASIEFNRDIRPILSEYCLACHGPDQNRLEGGLRLDHSETALATASSGKRAIVPHDLQASELVRRITSSDVDERMPPAKFEKTLNDSQKKLLQRWIEQGAKYQDHWAFLPPQRSSIPSGDFDGSHPIDAFLLRKLALHGIRPAPEADRATLIRRVALDLTGIPPTPDEIEQFLQDSSANAYEKMLDRYLQSPRYGERMAMPWLDHARYADSNGYQSDGSRDIWAWRDWVIQAYNRNLPFDQFTIEQLAGDMLPNPTRDQIIATGFNRNHRLNGEGGRIEAEWFVETVIDRVETTGLTWLGLTLNCCRCHDHKYDPITQKEFYSLFAYFNSVEESGVLAPAGKNGENTPPLLTLTTPDDEQTINRFATTKKELQEKLKQAEDQLPQALAEWEKTQKQDRIEESPSVDAWKPLVDESIVSSGGAQWQRQPDGSWLASGPNPKNDIYTFLASVPSKQLTALQVDVLPDASLPNQSLGRGSNGNFVLTSIEARWISGQADDKKRLPNIVISESRADYEQKGWPAASLVGKGKKNEGNGGWAIDGNDPDKRIPRTLQLILSKGMNVPKDAKLELVFRHQSQFGDHNVGRLRVSFTDQPKDTLRLDTKQVADNIQRILKIESSQRRAEDQKLLMDHFKKNVDHAYSKLVRELEQTNKQEQDFRDNLATTMVMKEGKKKDAFFLVRGQYDQPSDKVERTTPSFLPVPASGPPRDRLELARWIVDRSNPLTARVWINREWERFFGTGIVKTTENLGNQSEYPVHPELLDWLAVEFMEPAWAVEHGDRRAIPWDMKRMQKFIMMSQTYRRSSQVNREALKLDP